MIQTKQKTKCLHKVYFKSLISIFVTIGPKPERAYDDKKMKMIKDRTKLCVLYLWINNIRN
jgi:hypothetical protein